MYTGAPVVVNEKDKEKLAIVESFDLLMPTIYGLLDDLIPGSELMGEFLKEYESWLGTLVYYPRKRHLVRFAPPRWHRLSLLVRNSWLLRDPEMKLSWQEIRIIFDKAMIAVAGCSVGNGIAHAIVQDLRPQGLKIADQKEYHINNANRVRLSYEDFGRNKAIVTAEQIHAVDPFIDIQVFSNGVHPGCLEDFLSGVSVLIEETDDPDVKIWMREKAREKGIPVVMVTDIGSAIQLDVCRFDLSRSLPIVPVVESDLEVYRTRDAFKKDLGNREKFYDFFDAVVGKLYLKSEEFRRLIKKENSAPFGGIPQLGSTVMSAGGIAAEAVARLLLGYKLPGRMFFHKQKYYVDLEGGWR